MEGVRAMANVTFKGQSVTLGGNFPKVGDSINDFMLTAKDFSDKNLDAFEGRYLLLNIFPSVDTDVCADSVRKFNEEAGNFKNASVLCISKDLPFAQARFCGAENLNNVQTLSAFRNADFAKQFGVDIMNGMLHGLLARAVIIVNPERKVVYTELVPEITNKPDYKACIDAMTKVCN